MTAATTDSSTQVQQTAHPTHKVEAVKYNALAPIGSSSTLKALFDRQRESLAQVLPRHVTPDRLLKTFLVAANRTPDLFNCTQASILETISRAGELGLDLSGTLGEAYPVPFNNRVGDQWFKQCQLIIGYRGLAKLARQSGQIKRIEAEVVYENDDFTYKKGVNFVLEFSPNIRGDRGEPVGAYALVEFTDGAIQAEFMPVGDIEAVRKRSKSGSYVDKNGKEHPTGAWKTDWAEMAKKTVFRRLAKWLPLSAEKFQQALEIDNADNKLDSEVLEVSRVPTGSRAEALAKRLAQQSDEPEVDLRPTQEEPQETIQLDEAEPAPAAEAEAVEPAKPKRRKASGEPPAHERLAIIYGEIHGLALDEATAELDAHCQATLGKPLAELSLGQVNALHAQIKTGRVQTNQ